MPLVVVIDACALYPAVLRDTLLRCYEAGLFRLHITNEILNEVTRNLVRKSHVTQARAEKLANALHRAIPEAFVDNYKTLISEMTNDPKDRHVLAAAVKSAAQGIVTFNLSDFPLHALKVHGIAAYHPDRFLSSLLEIDEPAILEVLNSQAAALKNPPLTVDDVLENLAASVPGFVQKVRMSRT